MKRFMNLVQYSRESVTTVTVTLTSDTCDTFAGDTGTPNGRPYTTSPPFKYFMIITIFTIHMPPDSLAFFWSGFRVLDLNLPPLVL